MKIFIHFNSIILFSLLLASSIAFAQKKPAPAPAPKVIARTVASSEPTLEQLRQDVSVLNDLCGSDDGRLIDLEKQKFQMMDDAKDSLKQYSRSSAQEDDFIDLEAMKKAALHDGAQSISAALYNEAKAVYDDLVAQSIAPKENPNDCKIDNASEGETAYENWQKKSPRCLVELQSSCQKTLKTTRTKLHVRLNEFNLPPHPGQ